MKTIILTGDSRGVGNSIARVLLENNISYSDSTYKLLPWIDKDGDLQNYFLSENNILKVSCCYFRLTLFRCYFR